MAMNSKLDGLLSYDRRYQPIGKCVSYIKNKKEKDKLIGYIDRALTGRAKIQATYVEESPRPLYLPALAQAVAYANRRACMLIIPNIQHISRSLAGINALRDLEGSNPFIITVNEFEGKPYCRKEYVETFVGVFERSNQYKSENIRLSIAAKRKREPDWKPGNNTNIFMARQKAELSRMKTADEYVKYIIPKIRRIQAADRTTLQEIADSLMDSKERTPRGKITWTATTVRNVLQRAKRLGR